MKTRLAITLILQNITVLSHSQKSGTLKVAKPANAMEVADDTIRILFGDPKYYLRTQNIYPAAATANPGGFLLKKRLPSGYYIINYPEIGTMRLEGAVINKRQHGLWIETGPYDLSKSWIYEYNKGKLIRKFNPDNE